MAVFPALSGAIADLIPDFPKILACSVSSSTLRISQINAVEFAVAQVADTQNPYTKDNMVSHFQNILLFSEALPA